MKIRLTESKLKQIISESVKAILNENSPLKSKKLHDIFKQHGHTQYGKKAPWDKITDDMVLGAFSYEEYQRMASSGSLKQWAKDMHAELCVERLKDGNILVFVNPEWTCDGTEYWDLRNEREKSHRMHGTHTYYPQGAKGQAAEDIYKNPYIWIDKKKQKEDPRQTVGWPNDVRQELIRLAKNGKDRWSPEFQEFLDKREDNIRRRNRYW